MTTQTPRTLLDLQSSFSPELCKFATTFYEKNVPLLFAGEHTVYSKRGYMDSAIRSANAVAEILLK